MQYQYQRPQRGISFLLQKYLSWCALLIPFHYFRLCSAAIQHEQPVAPRYKLFIDDLLVNKSICSGRRTINATIPRLLFQMFWQTSDLPAKIAHNRQKYASGYEHRIYDNYAFSEMIQTYFTKEVHTEAMKLKGPHRADVFRYAVMYLSGACIWTSRRRC